MISNDLNSFANRKALLKKSLNNIVKGEAIRLFITFHNSESDQRSFMKRNPLFRSMDYFRTITIPDIKWARNRCRDKRIPDSAFLDCLDKE